MLADGDGDDRLPHVRPHPAPARGRAAGCCRSPAGCEADDWQGFHDPADLPRRSDPPEGFLATANEDLNRFGVAQPINLPGPPYRAQRIADLLGARSDWTVEALGAVQMDELSLQAQRFLAALAPLLEDDERFDAILRLGRLVWRPAQGGVVRVLLRRRRRTQC